MALQTVNASGTDHETRGFLHLSWPYAKAKGWNRTSEEASTKTMDADAAGKKI